MLCTITFWPSPSFFPRAPVMPTAMIAMGMAASNTCPTLRPRNAAAAENSTVISNPSITEYGVTSRGLRVELSNGL